MRVYADNAATTYMSEVAKEKFIECLDNYNGNPNSLHSDGQRTQEVLDEAREIVAECINAAKANEIYFTSGGSERIPEQAENENNNNAVKIKAIAFFIWSYLFSLDSHSRFLIS